jgi:hypothetical protein
MNWKNLKRNKCPKCGKDTAIESPFEFVPATKMLVHKCGFRISEQRYNKIVNDMVDQEIEATERGRKNA